MRPDVYGSLSRFLDWLDREYGMEFEDDEKQAVLGKFVGEGGLK